jgi:predicted small lipoprotein YifL
MRKIVSLLIVVALALALAGCGGGGDQAAETPAAAPAAAPAPAAAAAPASIVGDRSANVTATFEAFPQGAFVPADLKANIDAKRPTLIYFYDSSYTSETSRDIIDVVRDDNRGSVDLFAYDIAKYTTTSPQGLVSVDPALANDPAAEQAAQLAKQLGVTSVPFVVLTDAQGYITWKFRGLVDKAFLEREMQRAAP